GSPSHIRGPVATGNAAGNQANSVPCASGTGPNKSSTAQSNALRDSQSRHSRGNQPGRFNGAVPTAPAGIQRAEVGVEGRGAAHGVGELGGRVLMSPALLRAELGAGERAEAELPAAQPLELLVGPTAGRRRDMRRPASGARGYMVWATSSVIIPIAAWKKMWQCIAQRPMAPPVGVAKSKGRSSSRTR